MDYSNSTQICGRRWQEPFFFVLQLFTLFTSRKNSVFMNIIFSLLMHNSIILDNKCDDMKHPKKDNFLYVSPSFCVGAERPSLLSFFLTFFFSFPFSFLSFFQYFPSTCFFCSILSFIFYLHIYLSVYLSVLFCIILPIYFYIHL